MTRSGAKNPSPPASNADRSQPKSPARGPANSEIFGRFVRNLARLEGGAGRLDKAGSEKGAEGGR